MSPYNVPAHAIAVNFMAHLQQVTRFANDHPRQLGTILHDVLDTPTGKIVVEQFEAATGLKIIRPQLPADDQPPPDIPIAESE